MSFFRKQEKLGWEPIQKVIPVKIKKNVIISKQLHYKYALPDGFVLDENSGKDDWDGKKDYSEFAAHIRVQEFVSILHPMIFRRVCAHSGKFLKRGLPV